MSDIVLTRAEGVVTLTFNRPERRNALSTALGHHLLMLLTGLAQDESARVLILTGPLLPFLRSPHPAPAPRADHRV